MTARASTPCVLILCLLQLACGGGTGTRTSSDQPQQSPAAAPPSAQDPNLVRVDTSMMRDLRITTAAVESRAGGEEVTLLGELGVDERTYAEVGAPVGARVTKLLAGAGERVHAGQTLAELSSPELGRSRADYLSAEAHVKLSDAALQRKRDLAAERIVPQREVQEAEREAAVARAALRTARAALSAFGMPPPRDDADADADIAKASLFVLRAPVRGIVIERTAVVGQMLDPSAPAFRIGELSTLWLTVHAFERDAVRIQPGTPARLSFSALPGQTFDGRVAIVGRHVNRESRTVPVRIDVRNQGDVLRPGMSATASVAVGASGARILTVPVAAVQRVRNEWCVFVPKDAGTFEIRAIGRGRDLGGEIEVLSGLRAGETIVADGAFLLKAQAEKGDAGHDEHK